MKGVALRFRGAIVIAATALLVSWPEVVHACSVCFTGRGEETRAAFRDTTIFLSLLPLVVVGGMVWWLLRRARELEEVAEDGAPASADSANTGS